MTLSDAKALVASWVDDLSFGYFTSDQLTRYLNNGAYETQKLLIATGTNRYLKCSQTPTVINQGDYALPDDFLKVHKITMITGGTFPNETTFDLSPITLNQTDLVAGKSGQPSVYYLKKNKIVLAPVPQSVIQMRLYYSYRITQLSLDTDLFDIPQEYAEFPAVLAAIDCLIKDGRDMTSVMTKKTYYEDMLKADANERTVDLPRQIVSLGGGIDSGFGTGFW